MSAPQFNPGDTVTLLGRTDKRGNAHNPVCGLIVENVTGFPIHGPNAAYWRVLASDGHSRHEAAECFFELEKRAPLASVSGHDERDQT